MLFRGITVAFSSLDRLRFWYFGILFLLLDYVSIVFFLSFIPHVTIIFDIRQNEQWTRQSVISNNFGFYCVSCTKRNIFPRYYLLRNLPNHVHRVKPLNNENKSTSDEKKKKKTKIAEEKKERTMYFT